MGGKKNMHKKDIMTPLFIKATGDRIKGYFPTHPEHVKVDEPVAFNSVRRVFNIHKMTEYIAVWFYG